MFQAFSQSKIYKMSTNDRFLEECLECSQQAHHKGGIYICRPHGQIFCGLHAKCHHNNSKCTSFIQLERFARLTAADSKVCLV